MGWQAISGDNWKLHIVPDALVGAVLCEPSLSSVGDGPRTTGAPRTTESAA